MATASPVIINSSSPIAFRIPTPTPPRPQEQQWSSVAVSSSPKLPSPSAFVLSHAPGFKSGSRAQQLPEGANKGFASAGSLWRLESLDVKTKDDGYEQHGPAKAPKKKDVKAKQDEEAGSRRSSGKLVKPKKANEKVEVQTCKAATPCTQAEASAYFAKEETSQAGLHDFTNAKEQAVDSERHDALNRKSSLSLAEYTFGAPCVEVNALNGAQKAKPAKPASKKASKKTDQEANVPLKSRTASNKKLDAGDSHEKANPVHVETSAYFDAGAAAGPVHSNHAEVRGALIAATIPTTLARRPSTDFPAHTFEGPAQAPEVLCGEDTIKTSKKPRKRVAKKIDGEKSTAAKAPRKRKAKSEAIILNSDDFPPDDAHAVDHFSGQARTLQDLGENTEIALAKRIVKVKKPRITKSAAQSAELSAPESCVKLLESNSKAKETADLAETSTYFTAPSKSDPPVDSVRLSAKTSPANIISRQPSPEAVATAYDAIASVPASKRRLSWTPVKDTKAVDLLSPRPPTAGLEVSGCSQEPKSQLTGFLGSFQYVSKDAARSNLTEQTVTSESLPKKRRVKHADPTTTDGSTSLQATKPSKPTGKRKEPKKAQTITALATAAFQPPRPIEPEDSEISQFFVPTKPHIDTAVAQPKPRKPRKSRAKPVDENDAAAALRTTKKKVKPKAKFNEADYLPKLYSPGRATARFARQDFLFGTSSQLAVDEDPEFIRDMQKAVQESEAVPGPQLNHAVDSCGIPTQVHASPQKWKSCVRVPTAPHGTCLSVEQADKEMWCVSARDFKGGPFRCQGAKRRKLDSTALDTGDIPVSAPPIITETDTPVLAATCEERVVVGLYNTSPVAPNVEAPVEDSGVAFDQDAEEVAYDRPIKPYARVEEDLHQHSATNKDDDSWMLLQSDGPDPPVPRADDLQQTVPSEPKQSAGVTAEALLPSVVPPPSRSPLRNLDANANLVAQDHLRKDKLLDQARAFSSIAVGSAKSPTGRPRGRPRKEALAADTQQPSPKRRGRPPKKPALASDPSPQLPRPKPTRTNFPASQTTQASAYIDIDEISDSDTPPTPSPPRRRAGSPPLPVKALQLSPSGSPSIKARDTIVHTSTLKPSDSDWNARKAMLFPRITTAVKSAPRSTNSTKPTWWQKILLFDPIVLEDITAWLNAEGLRVEVRRRRPKQKKKRRKGIDAEADVDEGDDWELVEEPLQPWMVQKWCEEKSICCLWKEGLRGGVRTRY